MAVAVGDIIEYTLQQTCMGSTLLNVFHYEATIVEPSVDYDDVASAFLNVPYQGIKNCQATAVQYVRLLIRNLTNGIDIAETVLTDTGERSGEAATSMLAYGFRLNRSTAITRHGQKRIGGVSETDLTGQVPTAGMLVILADTADKFGEPALVDGTVDHDISLDPVIVGRFPTGHAQAGQLDLSKINPVASAAFVSVTTQTSRKLGRGV